MRTMSKVGLLAASLALAAVTSGCGGSEGGSGDGPVRIVASTDVWGDVARQVVGDVGKGGDDQVQITSIIDEPGADPHTYEASTRTQLAITRADVVIENGGGYDDFVTKMRKGAGAKSTLIDAVEISGKKAAAGAELNEHVWYDFPTVTKVADQIALTLGEKDPDHAEAYQSNAKAFATKVEALEQTEQQIKAKDADKGVAITEPVPLYLLDACGLVNKTPEAFSEAIEEDSDVSPTVLNQTLALFTQKQVAALVYNEQTSGPQTEQVLKASKAAGIPVVPVTETLPTGEDYLTWMQANLSAVESALG